MTIEELIEKVNESSAYGNIQLKLSREEKQYLRDFHGIDYISDILGGYYTKRLWWRS